MEAIVSEVSLLFRSFAKRKEDRIEKLPQSGGDRIYFRLYAGDQTYIAAYSDNVRENKTFNRNVE